MPTAGLWILVPSARVCVDEVASSPENGAFVITGYLMDSGRIVKFQY